MSIYFVPDTFLSSLHVLTYEMDIIIPIVQIRKLGYRATKQLNPKSTTSK